jgi:hypothetical protein
VAARLLAVSLVILRFYRNWSADVAQAILPAATALLRSCRVNPGGGVHASPLTHKPLKTQNPEHRPNTRWNSAVLASLRGGSAAATVDKSKKVSKLSNSVEFCSRFADSWDDRRWLMPATGAWAGTINAGRCCYCSCSLNAWLRNQVFSLVYLIDHPITLQIFSSL